MSMDSSGKIIWAKHSDIQQANLKNLTGHYLHQNLTEAPFTNAPPPPYPLPPTTPTPTPTLQILM